MTNWVLDIETTVDHERIRVAGLYGNGKTYLAHDADSLIDILGDEVRAFDSIWTWNGKKFDEPVLKRLWKIDLPAICKDNDLYLYDGYIFAKMLLPDNPQGHSLDAFAKRYNPRYKPWKPDDVSWYDTAPLEELVSYLLTDLKETHNVICHLCDYADKLGGSWFHGLKVEQRVRELTNMQVDKKVMFDIAGALKLLQNLDDEMQSIENALESWLPTLPVDKPHMPPKKQFKADGTLSANMLRYIALHNLHVSASAPYGEPRAGDVVYQGSVYVGLLPLTEPAPQFEKVSLGSQTKLKQWLISDMNWKPTWYNTKIDANGKKVPTSPRLSHPISKAPCPNLAKLGKQGEMITEWLMLRSRRSILSNASGSTGLIRTATNNGGFIASDGDTCGTNTARWRHKGIVNIPRVSSPKGREMRELFMARPGYVWTGWDASSLEACIEAHYTFPFDPAYALALVEGDSSKGTDVHTRNMNAIGLPNRDIAKTFKYAVTYGAQPPSLAGQIGVTLKEAQHLFDEFWDTNVGLRKLRDTLIMEWKKYDKKYIVGLDGRLIATRSEHSLINAKFQSGGAIVMKHAMLIAHKSITELATQCRFDAYGLIRYHDEEQWEVEAVRTFPEQVGVLGVQSITAAGKFLKLNVPLTGEYKVGKNWAETH